MIKKDILQRVLDQASRHGWKVPNMDGYTVDSSGNLLFAAKGGVFVPLSIYQILYSHDFAKALWGDHCGYDGCYDCEEYPYWKQNLQCMVVEDEFKYLEEYLDGSRA